MSANGQAALAFYSWDEEKQTRVPFAINVLTFEGEKIKEVDAFILRASQDPDPEVQARTPVLPADYEKLAAASRASAFPRRSPDSAEAMNFGEGAGRYG